MGVDVKASATVVVEAEEETEVVLAAVCGLEPAARRVTTAAVLFMFGDDVGLFCVMNVLDTAQHQRPPLKNGRGGKSRGMKFGGRCGGSVVGGKKHFLQVCHRRDAVWMV